ncbi:LuxR C-terminal-related transcriptional regulator [Streptomyces sp. NPDC051243]|uniref:LuxR C-terminal-related transcriptional regulator n=1 Tax=Streptomyces sp. NPDC051243 TaxID=3365646 RepID=UPI0037A68B08
MTIRILVAHAEGLARAGIIQLLGTLGDMRVVAQASTPAQTIRMSRLTEADVAIVDGSSHAFTRPETIGAVVRAGTDVLVLTPPHPDARVLEAWEAGAVGFLPMDSQTGDLGRALLMIAEGHGFMDPTIIRPLTRALGRQADEAPLTDSRLAEVLTPRERQVLAFLGEGRSNAEIAQRLMVSENTVKTHVSRLLAKLGLRSRVEAALAVRDGMDRVLVPVGAGR